MIQNVFSCSRIVPEEEKGKPEDVEGEDEKKENGNDFKKKKEKLKKKKEKEIKFDKYVSLKELVSLLF